MTKFEKIVLPYAEDALMPYVSAETIAYHYGKHHQAYTDKLNQLIENTPFAEMSIEEIIKQSTGALFNNAAQYWNHNFLWQCMQSPSDSQPTGKLAERIDQAFGSFAVFKEQFIASAIGNFGSGWTWLVQNEEGSLEILNTSNAETPLMEKF